MIKSTEDRISNAVYATERRIRANEGHCRIAPFSDRILAETARGAINRAIYDKIYHADVVTMLRARGYVRGEPE